MRKGNFKIRMLLVVAIVSFIYIRKCSHNEVNPYTERTQTIGLSPAQEIAIGVQLAPTLAQLHEGLHASKPANDLINAVGKKLIDSTFAKKSDYTFEFHLLRDEREINAFALPGGQIFITYALFSKLKNEDQLAGVLGHEIGHVLAKHTNERITKENFWKLVTMGDDLGDDLDKLATGIEQSTFLTNDHEDELECDELAVRLMIDADYNPEHLISVIKILKANAVPNRIPEIKSSHPIPEDRIEKIKAAIRKYRK
ncbi:M48 family metalloprotease [Polaribacter sp.]|uniref:M48 family metalloprotease n=1 Tax=Polaribacter sp. TaxID=1920175 RepID=UPI003EFA585D